MSMRIIVVLFWTSIYAVENNNQLYLDKDLHFGIAHAYVSQGWEGHLKTYKQNVRTLLEEDLKRGGIYKELIVAEYGGIKHVAGPYTVAGTIARKVCYRKQKFGVPLTGLERTLLEVTVNTQLFAGCTLLNKQFVDQVKTFLADNKSPDAKSHK